MALHFCGASIRTCRPAQTEYPGHQAELGLAYGSLPSDHQPRCFVIATSLQPTHKIPAIRSKQKASVGFRPYSRCSRRILVKPDEAGTRRHRRWRFDQGIFRCDSTVFGFTAFGAPAAAFDSSGRGPWEAHYWRQWGIRCALLG
jgi:hypothetical protein